MAASRNSLSVCDSWINAAYGQMDNVIATGDAPMELPRAPMNFH